MLDCFVDFSVFGGASTARARVVRRDAALRAARWILGRTGAPLIAEDIDETAEDILGGGTRGAQCASNSHEPPCQQRRIKPAKR